MRLSKSISFFNWAYMGRLFESADYAKSSLSAEPALTICIGHAHLNDSTKPARVANVLESDGSLSNPLTLVWVLRVLEECEHRLGHVDVVLSQAGLQCPGGQRGGHQAGLQGVLWRGGRTY